MEPQSHALTPDQSLYVGATMKHLSALCLALSFSLVLAAGCTEDSSTQPDESDTPLAMLYYPMVEGNSWTYIQGDDTLTVEAVSSLPEEYGELELSEGEVGQFTKYPDGSAWIQTISLSGDSVIGVFSEVLWGLLHRFNPALLGDTVSVSGGWPGSVPEPFYEILLERDATVTVPAGTFEHCLLIETVEGNRADGTVFYHFVTHYAPGVGMVRRERTYTLLPELTPSVTQLADYRVQ